MTSPLLGRAGLLLAALAASSVWAEEPVQAPLRDPWVPPHVRKDALVAPPARGEALQAEVERRLHAAFDAADVEGRGSITREQARAAGLGVVAQDFERIDRAHAGRVTFEDFRAFLRARRSVR